MGLQGKDIFLITQIESTIILMYIDAAPIDLAITLM